MGRESEPLLKYSGSISYESVPLDSSVMNDEGELVSDRVLSKSTRRMKDLYFKLMTTSWPVLFIYYVFVVVGVHTLFAFLFYLAGGDTIGNTDPSSPLREHPFLTAFFFSIHSFSTVGYGVLYPETVYCNVLVAIELIFQFVFSAILTGIFFSKFSRPRSKVVFSDNAVTHSRRNNQVLKFRMCNSRKSQIMEAQVRAVLALTEVDYDTGVLTRKSIRLELVQSETLLFNLMWTLQHVIDETSPLYQRSVNDLVGKNAEIVVSFIGVDSVFLETIYARYVYPIENVKFGYSFVNVFDTLTDGRPVFCFDRFNDIQKEQNRPEIDEDFI
ncbi:hypothetical protein PCE1_000902 [Barthelona sp. PCE]